MANTIDNVNEVVTNTAVKQTAIKSTAAKTTVKKTVASKAAKPKTSKPKAPVVPSFISLKNVNKTHFNSKDSQVPALKNINLELPSTGFYLITGESGSGKSTLLSILAGFDKIDSGNFVVNGVDFSKFKQRDLDQWRSFDTAYVFQDFNLISDYNVADNIRIGKNFQGEDCSDEEITKVLADVKLKGFEERMLNDLSGGEKQRVAIARALVRKPKVLFVDEPSAQLDKVNAQKILEMLKKISKEVLVLCVSHDIDLIQQYADRWLRLSNGKLTVNRKITQKRKKGKATAKLKKITKPAKLPEPAVEPIQRKVVHKRKHLINIGTNNVIKRKGRVFSLVLLSSIALLFFSIFYLLSGYNSYSALAQSILDEKPAYVAFSGDGITNANYKNISDEFDNLYFYRYANVDWQCGVAGLIEIPAPTSNNKGNSNIFGQKLLEGKYPILTEANGFNIVITDYLANEIIEGRLDLYDEGGLNLVYALTAGDIIGNSILSVNNIYLTVCGVVQTDYMLYESALPGTMEHNKFVNNLQSVYKVIHAAPGFISFFAGYTGINIIEDAQVVITGLASYDATLTLESYIGTKTVLEFGSNDVFSGRLSAGEIIVSLDIYAELINNSSSNDTMSFNLCGGNNLTYKVVGVLQSEAGDPSVVIFSSYDFKEKTNNIVSETIFPITMLTVSATSLNAQTLQNLIYTLETKYSINVQSASFDFIQEFSQKMDILKSTFTVFGIISLVFAGVLLYNYITMIITDRKKDIGIIRSLGATSKDISLILFTTVMIIFVSCFFLSAVFTTVAGFMINTFVIASMDIAFNIVALSWDLYLILLACNLAVCVVAGLVPIIRYSKQTPQQQLKR